MIYSRTQILNRLKSVLPARWFGETTPVLDSLLSCVAVSWASTFVFLDYAAQQTRIGSAFNSWLDLIAEDYFGSRIARRRQEMDISFRKRIKVELRRDRCTRAALDSLLQDLTGLSPAIFEPANPHDVGCYGSQFHPQCGMAGYGVSGGWGSLMLPFQVFVKLRRPVTAGVGLVNGWGGLLGGFGIGLSAYADSGTNSPQISDVELYQNIKRTAPAGTVVWTAIEP